jgi:hypothetical protein
MGRLGRKVTENHGAVYHFFVSAKIYWAFKPQDDNELAGKCAHTRRTLQQKP